MTKETNHYQNSLNSLRVKELQYKKKYAGTYIAETDVYIIEIQKNSFTNGWSGSIEQKSGYNVTDAEGTEMEATEEIFSCEWESKKAVKETLNNFLQSLTY